VVDGMKMCVSAVGNPHFPATRLWIPSPIGFIALKCFYGSEELTFLAFENVPMLERIETRPFSKMTPRSVAMSRSVEVLAESYFLGCELLS
jgi:hypothetical protein